MMSDHGGLWSGDLFLLAVNSKYLGLLQQQVQRGGKDLAQKAITSWLRDQTLKPHFLGRIQDLLDLGKLPEILGSQRLHLYNRKIL